MALHVLHDCLKRRIQHHRSGFASQKVLSCSLAAARSYVKCCIELVPLNPLNPGRTSGLAMRKVLSRSLAAARSDTSSSPRTLRPASQPSRCCTASDRLSSSCLCNVRQKTQSRHEQSALVSCRAPHAAGPALYRSGFAARLHTVCDSPCL